MYLLPLTRDARHRNETTRGSILASYAVLAAVPLALWAASNPLLAAGAIALAAGLRRAIGRVRSSLGGLLQRRTVTVTLGRAVEITVREPREERVCRREACC